MFINTDLGRSTIKYNRTFTEIGQEFLTKYKISNSSGYYLDVIATHYNNKKLITVEIIDVSIKPNYLIYMHEFEYEELEDTFFREGLFRQQFDGQNKLPFELFIQFVSDKYKNIKVNHIQKSKQEAASWYVLDPVRESFN